MKRTLFAAVTAGIVLACAACTAPPKARPPRQTRRPARPKEAAEQQEEPREPRRRSEEGPKEPAEAKDSAKPEKAAAPVKATEKLELFNGKDLTGWKLYVAKGEGGDADPARAFTVEGGVIRCTGNPPGYMRTEKDYEDYKLTVEWRFITGGASGKPGNSGVLVHMSPPDKVWPKSIECQGMHGSQGDLILFGRTEFKEHRGKEGRRVPKEGPSNEHPLGDWNVYEIFCRGDAIRPYVNGRLMNEATECSVTSGKICFQSEGAAWECRRITIEPVPAEEPDTGGEIALFNGKDLAGWKLHVSGDADPARTFKVEGGVLKCAGRPPGYMRTEEDYENYKLTVVWRFVKPGNSGVLVHMSPPDKVWPRSIECQGMHGNQGDFFVIGGTDFKEHRGKAGRRVQKRGPSNEKPLGQWNVYEIVCNGDTVRPYVNGRLMNEATECNVTRGKICIQSESAVWECSSITLGPVPAGEGMGDVLTPPGPPEILPRAGMLRGATDVTIKTEIAGGEIRYTLDGSEPSRNSARYAKPIRLDRSATVKARIYTQDGWESPVATKKFLLLPPEPPAPDVYISDLKPLKSVSGWGGDPKVNRSIEGNPLRVGGKRYEKGIGTHAHSEIVFGIEPRFRRFVAVVGADGEIGTGRGSIVFKVYADEELLAESLRIGGGEFWYFNVAIPRGAKRLRLLVTDAGDGIGHDHGDWVNAGFVTGGR